MPDSLLKLLFLLFVIMMIALKHYLISLRPKIAVIHNHCYLAGAFDNAVSAEIINNTMKVCYNGGEFNYGTFRDDCICRSTLGDYRNPNDFCDGTSDLRVQSNIIHVHTFLPPIRGRLLVPKSWSFDLKHSETLDFGTYDDICKYRLINLVGLNHGEPLTIPFTIYQKLNPF